MVPPNFFIVGAPKAGTTALASYLGDHPGIFISSIKEPHYFAADLDRPAYIRDKAMYLSLFRKATNAHVAVGEASVWYLFSSVAVRNIREFNPNAKITVMVRNPLEMIPSLHSQLLFIMCEDRASLHEAWGLQADRANGRSLPDSVQAGRFPAKCLQYAQVAKQGEQLERLLSIFPAEQVKIILFDDFRADPGKVYEETLSFLGAAPDGRRNFPVVNDNKVLRFRWLGNPVNSGSRLGAVITSVKRKLGLKSLGLTKLVQQLNGRREVRKPISPAFRAELSEVFREDVLKISRIVDRDLTSWLSSGSTSSRLEEVSGSIRKDQP